MLPTTASVLGPKKKIKNNNNNNNNIVLIVEKEKNYKVKIAVLFIK